jgi:formylglycine-generating enzyme required for sulfatase activity
LASVLTPGEAQFCAQFVLGGNYWTTVAIGGFRTPTSDLYLGWRWTTDETFIPNSLPWMSGNPGCCGPEEYFLGINKDGQIGDLRDCAGDVGAIIEWSADCNSDGIVDYGQILAGQLADANTNGIPDICECATHPELGACRCAGDIVADGTVNGADLGTLLAYWGPRTSGSFSIASDINGDGHIDGSDLGVLLANWGTCTPAGPTVPGWATLIEASPDPAVVTDPALRMAIAATGLAWRVRDTGTGIEMLLVPPGTFQMGCSASQQFPCTSAENPRHPVTLTQAFYLGRFETTQQQWQAKMGSNPSEYQGYQDSHVHPVEHLNWTQVQSFLSATGMRLPTESEWEYACRGGTTSAFPNGTNDDNSVESLAWYSANSESRPHPVGRKAPNGLGLHDMLGNVWEWVNDWYGPYSEDPQTNPQGPSSGPYREIRGGAWIYATDFVRSSYRGYVTVDNPGFGVGFRAARNP